MQEPVRRPQEGHPCVPKVPWEGHRVSGRGDKQLLRVGSRVGTVRGHCPPLCGDSRAGRTQRGPCSPVPPNLLLPSLRGQRCCDNPPTTAQHSPTGVTWVTAATKSHQSWPRLIPAPLLGCKDGAITLESLRGPCHHTLHCGQVGTHSQPLLWSQQLLKIDSLGSSQSNKGFILTEPVPVSLSPPRAHCGWIRAEFNPK